MERMNFGEDEKPMSNIVLNKIPAANSSVFPYQPVKAIDGVATELSRWVGSTPYSVTPAPNWLKVDLGTYHWLNRWMVKQMGSAGWSANYNLVDYKLQGSLDNANWFDIDAVTNNSAHSTDRTVIPTKVRWARIYVTKGLRCNINFASIVDLELYAAEPTSTKLMELTVSVGTLEPPFTSTTDIYTLNVGYDNTSITMAPTVEDSRATIKVNGEPVASGQTSAPVSLNVGSNPVIIEITPFIGDPQNYTIEVIRTSSPYLTGLAIDGMRGGGISPPFNRTVISYTSNVLNAKSSINIIPIAEDSSNSTITVNGSVVQSGALSQPINLNVGDNTVTTVVASEIGVDQKTYTIIVTRLQP